MRKVTALLAVGMCLAVFAAIGTAWATTQLEATEYQITTNATCSSYFGDSTCGNYTPTIAQDAIGTYIVYTEYPIVNGQAGNSAIFYQRITNDGQPTGSPIWVPDGGVNTYLNDAYGDYIVYTRSSAVDEVGDIVFYQISTGNGQNLTDAGENTALGTWNGNYSPKIYGTYVVWLQDIEINQWIPRNFGLTPNSASLFAIVNGLAISPGFASDKTLLASTDYGVYISTDLGGDWTAVGTPVAGGGAYLLVLSPGYATDQTLFAESSGGVYKSTNGGATWTFASSGLPYVPGIGLTSVALSPAYATDQTLFTGWTGGSAAQGGGVYKSTDGGDTWTAVNSGLSGGQVSALALSPAYATDQTLFTGTYNGVFKSTNGGATWTAVNSGLPSGQNGQICSVALSPNYASDQTVFAGVWNGDLYKSTNGGATWTAVNYFGISFAYNSSVITLAFSPGYASDQTLFAGTYGGGVFKSTDGGTTWSYASAGLYVQASQGTGYGIVSSVVLSPAYASDQTLFAVSSNGGVFLSETGGIAFDGTQLLFCDISSGYPYSASVMAGPTPFVEDATIGNRFIAWSQVTNNQEDIAAYDMTLGLSFYVAQNPQLYEYNAATNGSWIAWESSSVSGTGGTDIQAADFGTAAPSALEPSTLATVTVASNGASNLQPAISGNLLSYESNVSSNYQIYVYRFAQGDTFQVTNSTYDEYFNNLWSSSTGTGGLVAYVDSRSGSDQVYVTNFTFVTSNPTFSVGSVAPLEVSTGESTTAPVTISSNNGFNSPVTLSVSSTLPNGVSVVFSPNPVTPPAGGAASSVLTLSLLPFVTPGTFTMTITGTSGSLTQSANANVTVNSNTSGITSVIEQLLVAGCINSTMVANGLTGILSAAQKAVNSGNLGMAILILDVDDFITGLLADNGKYIKSSCTVGGITFNPANVLINDVTTLNESLEVSATPNPIMGYVVNSSGLSISGVTVSIVNSAGKTVKRVNTDALGFYLFPTTGVLTTGSTYTVQVTIPKGYTTSTPANQTFTWEGTAITLANFVLN